MKTVTKVTRQRRPGRYNIYFDNEFGLAVDEKVLIKYDLFKGTELDDAALEEVINAEFAQKAYLKALTYATGRMRSKMQVVRKLKEDDVPNAVIGDVINRLEAANVLDDAKFAEEYVRSATTSGKLGPQGVANKLREFGVDKFLIQDALVAFEEEDQEALLQDKVAKLMAKNHRYSHFMAEQKTKQKLMQLGFDGALIARALKDYVAENATDIAEEAANLDRDANAAASRYQQYDGWDFTRRVKQAMYRKGYDLGQVDDWLRDNGYGR
jgi:regulatory protein